VTSAVLALGANLGDPAAQLQAAVDTLGPLVVAVSPAYHTSPWGPVRQVDYLNAVVVADDPGRVAEDWLELAAALEQAAGRKRTVRWGARTLDVDVVVVRNGGRNVVKDDPGFTLPHPRAHERAFVLVPWADVDPGAVLPGYGRVADLAAAAVAADPGAVRRCDDVVLVPAARTAVPPDAR